MHKKTRIFISYGHKDGFDFVRRLAFSLEMYVDVFWDKRLRDGTFDSQLVEEIKKCDYFLIVMTPYALREKSDDGSEAWCRIELRYAEENNKRIVPIKLHNECGFPDLESRLENPEKIQYADFRHDFDSGFQRLTQILLDYPFLSWEYCTLLSDEKLLEQLKEGRLPVVIAKEIAEWVSIHKLWQTFTVSLTFSYPAPKTIFGIHRALDSLTERIEFEHDTISHVLAQDIESILLNFAKPLSLTNELQYQHAGELAYELIFATKDFCLSRAFSLNNVEWHIFIENNFDFEIAEQLREYINLHSRRSRYLY